MFYLKPSTTQEKIETVNELVLCFWNSSKINYRQQRPTTLNICNFFTSPNIQKYLGAKKPQKYQRRLAGLYKIFSSIAKSRERFLTSFSTSINISQVFGDKWTNMMLCSHNVLNIKYTYLRGILILVFVK